MSKIQEYLDMYINATNDDELLYKIFDYIDATYTKCVNICSFNIRKYTMSLEISVDRRQVYGVVYLYNSVTEKKHYIYGSLNYDIYEALACMKDGDVMLSCSMHLFPDNYLTDEMCQEICDKHLEEFPDEDDSPMLYTDSSIMKLFATKITEHDLVKCYEDFMVRMHKEYTESLEEDIMVKPAWTFTT